MRKVIAGGQAGVEQAAWSAARRAGIATGGYMPARFATEAGPAPRLGLLHGAIEFPFDDDRRSRANARHADAVLWLGDPASPGARSTRAAAEAEGKPFLAAHPDANAPADVVAWLRVFEVQSLMVAGDPASKAPGLTKKAEAFLDRVFAATVGRMA